MKNIIAALWLIVFVFVVPGCGGYDDPYLAEIEALNAQELTDFRFEGNTLIMNNEINSQTPRQLRDIFANHPGIDTIFMGVVPGSIDDEANLEAAIMVAQKGITTMLGRYSFIASGGTDFFLAGKRRIIERGAQVGVHSWADEDSVAADYPRGHKYHQFYINYYQQVGWGRKAAEDFYYYTIESAPVDNLHIMSEQELQKYGIMTEHIKEPVAVYLELEEDIIPARGYAPITENYAREQGIEILQITGKRVFPYNFAVLPEY